MWEKNKGTTECDKSTITCDVGTLHNVRIVSSNVRKNKGTTECDKNIVICDISTTQCDDGTIKCDVLVTWYSKLPASGYRTQKKRGALELP